MNVRKVEIIKIATKLFSERGYDNTSTRELANAVGLSVAGIYYFFQNKEEILFTILDLSLIGYLESLRSVINVNNNPQTNLTQLIECMVKLGIENKREITLVIKEIGRLGPEQVEIIKKREKDVYILIRKEILRLKNDECIKDLNLSFLSFALLGMINYSHKWFKSNSQLSIEELVAEATELFFNGVLKSEFESSSLHKTLK